jgi:hypothetical protein
MTSYHSKKIRYGEGPLFITKHAHIFNAAIVYLRTGGKRSNGIKAISRQAKSEKKYL